MNIPTIQEAVALYMSVPSLVTAAGDASIKLRATGTEIVRESPESDEFSIQYTQVKIVTLPNGEKFYSSITPISGLKASDLVPQTVAIDGQEWPIALAYAIIAAVYVREATK